MRTRSGDVEHGRHQLGAYVAIFALFHLLSPFFSGAIS